MKKILPPTNLNINVDKGIKKELQRKAVHLSSLWVPSAIYFVPEVLLLPTLVIILCGNIALEYANFKRYRWARKSFGAIFFRLLREKETSRGNFQFTGSVYVLASAILCMCLFSKEVAVIAMTVMLISDSAAALIGRTFGKTKIYKKKTLEGTLAFFISALVINLLFIPIYPFRLASLLACAAATAVEVYEDKIGIDDNLSIPLTFSTVISLILW
ncbi:MAG: SEC59/DGK1/VTE5 family protein [Rhodospirillales bacterium]|nr:SEC59/DGK1/VTE5 family protein [Rhodospirillales bacterium]